MQITVRNDHRAEVLLSAGEMEHYGITYEEMDYSDAETRRMLWSLISDIKKLSGLSLSLAGRLLIEVMKEKSGNVRICFTELESKLSDPASFKQLVKSEAMPVVAEFTDIENIISLSFSAEKCIPNALYEKNGKYRVICFCDEKDKEWLEAVLSEFGHLTQNSRLETALCQEGWHCIIGENALGFLRQVFSENPQQLFCRP